MKTDLIQHSVIDLIASKYQITQILDLANYHDNPEALALDLEKYYDYTFSCNQCLLILHHDTDYYPNLEGVGNMIYNLMRLFANFLIPLDRVIILTNHYGIDKEITKVAGVICNSDAPKVIYTSQWSDFPDINQISKSVPTDSTVNYLFCCLNGVQRQHRIMTLCMLAEYQLLDNGIISYHFGNT
jgi:hypothetical protein